MENLNQHQQIVCGKCNCKFYARLRYYTEDVIASGKRAINEAVVDNSCPQCGHGAEASALNEIPHRSKQLLFD